MASAGELDYPPGVRSIVVALVLLGVPASPPVRATEQTVVPLSPGTEQDVRPIGGDTQRVEPVEQVASQTVDAPEPPTPTAKAASTAGKVVLSVMAAVVSVGVMAASLLFL